MKSKDNQNEKNKNKKTEQQTNIRLAVNISNRLTPGTPFKYSRLITAHKLTAAAARDPTILTANAGEGRADEYCPWTELTNSFPAPHVITPSPTSIAPLSQRAVDTGLFHFLFASPLKGLLAANAIPCTSWEALFYVLFPQLMLHQYWGQNPSASLSTDLARKANFHTGHMSARLFVTLSLITSVSPTEDIGNYSSEVLQILRKKDVTLIKADRKTLHVPKPTNRKLEESNKPIEPLHNRVWGSKSSQQEKLPSNAAIKLSTRNVSNGNSATSVKINGSN